MGREKKETKIFVDHSIVYKPYWLMIAVEAALWIAYVVWVWQAAMVRHVVPFVDGAIQIVILWYMINVVTCKVEYRLGPDALVMKSTALLRRKKEVRLTYDEIFGVHHFKNQLMKPVTYRFTYRMYSMMDNRTIWSLLCRYGDSTRKVGRILMKGSEPFWKAFEERLPKRIRVPQEEVLAYTYAHMGQIVQGKDPGAGQSVSFEEGIKQLRQTGTEMGGRDYEVTGEDFKDRPEGKAAQSGEVTMPAGEETKKKK